MFSLCRSEYATNGPLPQFMGEAILEAVFFDDESTISPCIKELRNGLSELGIFQVSFV